MLIIFDLDDTLIDTSGSITPVKLREAVSAAEEAGHVFEDKERALARLIRLNESSGTAKAALERWAEEEKIADIPYRIGLSRYESFPEGIDIHLVPGVKEVLSAFSGAVRMAIVSRGDPARQRFKIRQAGISERMFYKIFVSESVDKGVYYERLISELEEEPSRVIVCGDRFDIDLLPAKRLGCVTVQMQFGRGKHLCVTKEKPDYIVTCMSRLIDITKKIENKNILESL